MVIPDGRLVAGRRRLAALEHLGQTEVPVTVFDLDLLLERHDAERGALAAAEVAENSQRLDLQPSELYVALKRIEERIKPAKFASRSQRCWT